MEHYIIDTNFIFNLEIQSGFGKNPKEIIENLTHYGDELLKTKKAQLYMPPRIVDELYTFIDKDTHYLQAFLAVVSIMSPDISTPSIPLHIFYKYVQEQRDRAYRGLQVGDETIEQVAKNASSFLDKSVIELQKEVGGHIKRFRERYRTATRVGFLDSLADLDLIILAKSLNGSIVTSDEGVKKWGREFGVLEIPPHLLKTRLDLLLGA